MSNYNITYDQYFQKWNDLSDQINHTMYNENPNLDPIYQKLMNLLTLQSKLNKKYPKYYIKIQKEHIYPNINSFFTKNK